MKKSFLFITLFPLIAISESHAQGNAKSSAGGLPDLIEQVATLEETVRNLVENGSGGAPDTRCQDNIMPYGNLRLCDLYGANLSGQDLSRVNLTGATLTFANVSNTTLTNTFLVGANAQFANFDDSTISFGSTDGTDFSHASFARSRLEEMALLDGKLIGADFTDALLVNNDMIGATMDRASVTGASLTGNVLTGSRLNSIRSEGGTTFKGMAAMNVSMVEANLPDSRFEGIVFEQSNLALTIFTGSSFVQGELFGNQQPLSFSGSDLSRAEFYNTYFDGVEFVNVTLRYTRFDNAEFHNTNFSGTDMTMATFSGATMDNVTCADGTNSDFNGGSCAGHLSP